MYAVIMAGGEGSRLRPLTCDMPKPMARLCGRPILEYILDLLIQNGVDHAAVTLRYMPHVIRDHFPDETYRGITLEFFEETNPLGTAGGVKNASPGCTDDVLVISGDGLCDFDLKAAYDFHKRSGGAVTIVTTPVDDPREYGLVNTDASGRVIGFTEKPPWSGVTTDHANTGIYFLRPDVLDLIPNDRSFDFANHLFPLMLSKNMPIMAYAAQGYWCDIGDLQSYRACQQDLLGGRVAVELPKTEREGVYGNPPPAGNYKLFAPVYIGDRVHIGEGAIIGPDTVLDDGVEVGANARVRSAILLPGSMVGNSARLTGSLMCAGSSAAGDASLYEGVTLGAGAMVGRSAEILPGVSVWPGKTVDAGVKVTENIRVGESKSEFFHEDGISGVTGVDMTPEFCAKIGAAVGSLKGAGRIGVGYGEGSVAAAMAMAVMAGLTSTGVRVWNFGRILETQIRFAASSCALSACVYITGNEECAVKILGSDGLPCTRAMEREISGYLQKGEFIRCHGDHVQEIADMAGIRLLYQQELYRCAPGGLADIAADLRCQDREGERLMQDTFRKLGGTAARKPCFTVSKDGCRVTAVDEQGETHSSDRMLTLCCTMLLEEGEDLAVPFDAPKVLDDLAAQAGRQCRRYFFLSAEKEDETRSLAKRQYHLRDGMMMAFLILSAMKRRGQTLNEWMTAIPAFATRVEHFELHQSPSSAMQKLSEISVPDTQGVQIRSGDAFVRIWPDKRGKSLRVTAEADTAEIATELWGDIRKKMSDLLDTN